MTIIKIFVVSGPSGAGKTTLLNSLLDVYVGSEPLVRVTTRSKRKGDSLSEYQYVSLKRFNAMTNLGLVINPVIRNGFSHGIVKESLTKVLSLPAIQFADLSPESTFMLAEYIRCYTLPRTIVPIFLANCSTETLSSRMRERGEIKIEKRLSEALNWQVEAELSPLKYVLIDANQTKQEVLKQVVALIDC